MTVKQAWGNSGYDQTFSQTVSRELVHRRAVAEVFPTAIGRIAASEFTVCAQWPRWHVFYDGLNSGFDSALVVETLRQLTVLIAHTQLAVPLGRPFLMPDMAVQLVPGILRDTSRPTEVTAQVKVTDQRQTPTGLTAFRATALFRIDGQQIASGSAAARIVDPEVYERFRSGAQTVPALNQPISPVPANSVGHTSNWNVVVGHPNSPGRWPLRVDTSNPILFDHPLDHVPGVLLIEAVRQVLRLELRNPRLDFVDFEARFLALIELEIGAEVVLESLVEHQNVVTAVVKIQAEGGVAMRAIAHVRPKRLPSGDQRVLSVRQGRPDVWGSSPSPHE